MSGSTDDSRDAVNKVFGDPLPDTTRDERENDRAAEDGEHERWLRENIPPHHG